MVSLIALLVLMIGGLNWFCIGALQYDFVAGLFGSQANIFSRLVYVIVGISSIIVGYYTIKNKGKVVSFKKVKSMFPKKKEKEYHVDEKHYSSNEDYSPKSEHAYHEHNSNYEELDNDQPHHYTPEYEHHNEFEDKE